MSKESHLETRDPRIDFFDSQAARWGEFGPTKESIIECFEQMGARLELEPGRNILELGCGPGQFTGWICRKVAPGKVTATDFSPLMIAEACKQVLPAEFMVSDICIEPPAIKAYHTVFCYNAFPHFRDKAKALKNIARSLKKDGVLIILHFHSREELNNIHKSVGGAVEEDFLLERAEMEELFLGSGLKLTEFEESEKLYFLKAVKE